MQLWAMLVTPSSNHLIETWCGSNEVFLTLVKGLNQSMRFACSPQKAFGSLTERAYIASYLASSMKARFFHSGGTS